MLSNKLDGTGQELLWLFSLGPMPGVLENGDDSPGHIHGGPFYHIERHEGIFRQPRDQVTPGQLGGIQAATMKEDEGRALASIKILNGAIGQIRYTLLHRFLRKYWQNVRIDMINEALFVERTIELQKPLKTGSYH